MISLNFNNPDKSQVALNLLTSLNHHYRLLKSIFP
jgi:hypothetical protein